MSIEQFGGIYTPTCDVCGAELPPEDDFYDAVQAKKDAGWKAKIIDGQWEDWCDECQRAADGRGDDGAWPGCSGGGMDVLLRRA